MSFRLDAGLSGRRAMVTGAAGTIGAAVTRALAASGCRVCLVDVSGSGLAAVVGSLEQSDSHLAVGCDLLDSIARDALFRQVEELFGGLDILVHVAGVLARTAVDDVTEDIWNWHLDNNLKATFFVDRAAARLMQAGGHGGRIVNFASDAWWHGGNHAAAVYAASKGGVVSLSRGLARHYARDAITVNCIAPGTVDSPMLRCGLTADQLAHVADPIPLGRLATAADVASATLFLVSEHASYITATTLNVSGGELIY